MFKGNDKYTRTSCEIFSKLIIKTSLFWFLVKFEHIPHLALEFEISCHYGNFNDNIIATFRFLQRFLGRSFKNKVSESFLGSRSLADDSLLQIFCW